MAKRKVKLKPTKNKKPNKFAEMVLQFLLDLLVGLTVELVSYWLIKN